MVTHSSILAWRIPWTEELGELQSMGSQRTGYKEGLTLLLSEFVAYNLKKGMFVFLPGQLPVLSITYSNVCKVFLKCQAVQ